MELRKLFGVQTQSKVPFNYEDMSDFSDADISTGLFTIYNFSCLFTYTYYINTFCIIFLQQCMLIQILQQVTSKKDNS